MIAAITIGQEVTFWVVSCATLLFVAFVLPSMLGRL